MGVFSPFRSSGNLHSDISYSRQSRVLIGIDAELQYALFDHDLITTEECWRILRVQSARHTGHVTF
jgi:hypothetical protein